MTSVTIWWVLDGDLYLFILSHHTQRGSHMHISSLCCNKPCWRSDNSYECPQLDYSFWLQTGAWLYSMQPGSIVCLFTHLSCPVNSASSKSITSGYLQKWLIMCRQCRATKARRVACTINCSKQNMPEAALFWKIQLWKRANKMVGALRCTAHCQGKRDEGRCCNQGTGWKSESVIQAVLTRPKSTARCLIIQDIVFCKV